MGVGDVLLVPSSSQLLVCRTWPLLVDGGKCPGNQSAMSLPCLLPGLLSLHSCCSPQLWCEGCHLVLGTSSWKRECTSPALGRDPESKVTLCPSCRGTQE